MQLNFTMTLFCAASVRTVTGCVPEYVPDNGPSAAQCALSSSHDFDRLLQGLARGDNPAEQAPGTRQPQEMLATGDFRAGLLVAIANRPTSSRELATRR